ncbi:MAG: isopropylmalate synthase [Methanotrichaceae archaeon]|nr:isopropylmalate synthase [Methanotrichaceae archaeon]
MLLSYEDLPKLKLPLGQEVYVSDSTLRDGAQMPGLVIKAKDKLKIYDYLNKIGIDKMEVFLFTGGDKETAQAMINSGNDKPEVTGWARANNKDIDLVLDVDEIKETGILMSISDVHIRTKMGLKSLDEAEKKYLQVLEYALDHGLRIRAHLEDITRADLEGFVYPLVSKILERAPECTLRICDTLGLGVPFENATSLYNIPLMVERLLSLGARNVETHIHDDFGLGTANSLAGYWYGANWSNLTFLGIGERAGNSELEKALLFLVQRVEGFQKYDLTCLTEFAEYMENQIGLYIPRNKAVVGKNVFAHESGIHTAGVIKNPFVYEPYPPELVGGNRRIMIGNTSGTEVVRFKVEETLKKLMNVDLNLSKDDWRVLAIHSQIKQLYDEELRSSCISDEEMTAYVEKYFLFKSTIEKETNNTEEINGSPLGLDEIQCGRVEALETER